MTSKLPVLIHPCASIYAQGEKLIHVCAPVFSQEEKPITASTIAKVRGLVGWLNYLNSENINYRNVGGRKIKVGGSLGVH